MDLAATYARAVTPWWTYLIVVGVVAMIAWGIIMTWVGREGKIRGPALTGTAQILSVRTLGAVAAYPRRVVCRVRLRVDVPGHEPYETTARQNFTPWVLDAHIHAGGTVAVRVNSTNPKHVQIDLSRPVHHPPQAGSAGSTRTVAFESPPTGDITDQISEALEDVFKQTQAAGSILSAADLLASGQRVPAVLKSFAATGTTPRSLGRTPSKPELLDAPHYVLEVELHFPNLTPMTAQAIQPVPVPQVPNLAIGLKVPCVVDPADPARRFVVDWNEIAH
jgi:hypothetical protein